MNLIIDQGNTVCKVAVAAEGRLIQHYTYPHLSLREAGQVLSAHPGLEAAIYSSVARVDKPLLGLLSERLHTMVKVDETTAIPLEVAYDRKRLGSDRLVAVVGAYSLAPKGSDLLVIDSGTAITFERITQLGVYLGGNISPGLYTRLKALNHFTSRLPLLSDLEDTTLGFGVTTQEAISRGVLQGLIYEVEGYIKALRRTNPEAVVFLTGGDAQMIQELLSEEVCVEPDLVLYGLNKILEYNRDK